MRNFFLTVVTLIALSARAEAQSGLPSVAVPPANLMLPNYVGVPVGEIASLEAGAFLVRANDTSSIFYNPAGVTRADRTSISGSAGVFQLDTVTPRELLKSGTAFQQIPSMFAVVLKDLAGRPNLAGGLAIARVNAWSQSVSAERTFEAGTTTDRLSYSSDASFEGWLANIGVGVRLSEKVRVGGSFDGQLTMSDRRQTASEQYRNGSTLSALVIETQGSAYATHLRLTAGGQYDVTPQLQLGAVLRTRGVGLLSGGASSFEGVSRVGSTTITASHFDDAGATQYRIPFEFKAGAAYAFPRGQLEVDLLAYAGAGVYDGFTSDRPTTILTDSSSGSVTAQPFATKPAIVDSRRVINIAAGGHFDLTTDRKWVIHAGYGTDRSPVGDQDTSFTKINLQKVTVGVSGRTTHALGSLGVQYATGSSAPIVIRELQNGQRFTTRFDVRNIGFVYSLALIF